MLVYFSFFAALYPALTASCSVMNLPCFGSSVPPAALVINTGVRIDPDLTTRSGGLDFRAGSIPYRRGRRLLVPAGLGSIRRP